jgi:preprotein translocase subunit SecF
MRELFYGTFFDFVGKRYVAFTISGLTFLLGVIGYIVNGGLNYNIDFTGGKLYELQFMQPINVEQVREVLGVIGLSTSDIQVATDGTVLIRMQNMKVNDDGMGTNLQGSLSKALPAANFQLEPAVLDFAGYLTYHLKLNDPMPDPQLRAAILGSVGGDETRLVVSDLRENVEYRIQVKSERYADLNKKMAAEFQKVSPNNPYQIRRDEVVGPKVGQELRLNALYAILASLAGILIYVAIRFRTIGGFRAGTAAVVALFHDTFITLGLFAFLKLEFSLTVLAAILTLIGYSIMDTIVVYDRIRENLRLSRKSYPEIVNAAINQTLSRTVIPVLTVLFVLISLFVMGGPVLQDFTFAMIFGVITGTYSSIFVAAPILVEWEKRSPKRVIK